MIENKQVTMEVNIARIQTDMGYMKADIVEIKNEIKNLKDGFVTKIDFVEAKLADKADAQKVIETFVTKEAFRPYQVTLGLIGTAVVISLINNFLKLIHL